MPTFTAEGPIRLDLDLTACFTDIVASDRADVTVTVEPHDSTRRLDQQAAQATTAAFDAGTLRVQMPRGWSYFTPFGGTGCVRLRIEAPAGSALYGRVTAGTLTTRGVLGDVSFRTGAGAVEVESGANVELTSSAGDIRLGHATGWARLKASAGRIRTQRVDGGADIYDAAGSARLGDMAGGVTARVTTGDLRVASTSGNVELRVGTGTVRVGSAGAGVLHVTCGYGPIEVGVPAGTATFVDAGSRHGRVLNQLTAAEAPAGDAPHAEIHASTRFGDITLYRA